MIRLVEFLRVRELMLESCDLLLQRITFTTEA
jgi:hypothetical protein